jgi:hypothetical protein
MSSVKYLLTYGPIVSTVGSVKRRKPKAERKETSLRIRLTAEQKERLTKAAKKAGLDASGWVRSIALREADRS